MGECMNPHKLVELSGLPVAFFSASKIKVDLAL